MADLHSTSHPHRPLLPTAAVVSSTRFAGCISFFSSNSAIFIRLVFILSVGMISLWANYEASKGFQVQIFNDAGDSPAGKRFALFYISNDRATRILLNASTFVEHLVYSPDDHPNQRKPVRQVTLRLASTGNVAADETVTSHGGHDEFVIRLSPSLMLDPTAGNRDSTVASAVLRGMARVWLWDGGEGSNSKAPSWVIEAAVECVSRMAGFSGGGLEESPAVIGGGHRRRLCWGETTDARLLAGFMEHCERRSKGFLRRLNQALRSGWKDRATVEEAAAMTVEQMCESYKTTSPQDSIADL